MVVRFGRVKVKQIQRERFTSFLLLMNIDGMDCLAVARTHGAVASIAAACHVQPRWTRFFEVSTSIMGQWVPNIATVVATGSSHEVKEIYPRQAMMVQDPGPRE